MKNETFDLFSISIFTKITLCIKFTIFSLNPIILYASSTKYRLAFKETFELFKKFFFRVFSCFNKSKFLAYERSKTPSFVIGLSSINKGCEGN